MNKRDIFRLWAHWIVFVVLIPLILVLVGVPSHMCSMWFYAALLGWIGGILAHKD